ncbi:MAG TPA: glycoside hydrolase family 44 protein [Terracidiphilus sp.]|nr:glycoside hydrolase family 44 protein [Terracidiphilus sp.]
MMTTERRAAARLLFAGCFLIAACGGSLQTPPNNKITPTVTVSPSSTSIVLGQSLSVTVSVIGTPSPTGSITLTSGSYTSGSAALVNGSATIVIPANTFSAGTATLTAAYTPDATSSSTYNSATGTASLQVNALITPTVSVTPGSSSITVAQSLSVTISVSSTVANPVPITGSVTLSDGSYTSAAATLSGGSAIITIPANNLAAGTATLTAVFTPDQSSSSTYTGATGTGSVIVTALINPTVTVTPGLSSITSNQSLSVTVAVAGGSGNPTPTGSVTLVSGSYSSGATTISNGSASITIPANKLADGTATLTATYTPDTNSSSIYVGATGTGSVTVTAPTTYVLTIDSSTPASGIPVTVSPADVNGQTNGTTPFTRTYDSGTQVSLTAAATSGSYSFSSWTGCSPAPTTTYGCVLTISANSTVTAAYNPPASPTITVTPTGPVTIGTQQQFAASFAGFPNGTSQAVTWKVSPPSGSSLSAGDISSNGLYNTPYPAPATVTVTATSVAEPTVSGSASITLSPPAVAAGPVLTVDAGNRTHAISPDIYGMNAYSISQSVETAVNLPVDRWGGDATTRYNYTLDVTNAASDWYFENGVQGGGTEANSAFNSRVESDEAVGAKTLGTVPVMGWVAKSGTGCSFPSSTYPNQVAFEPYGDGCGDGMYPDGVSGCTSTGGCNITGNDPTVCCETINTATWAQAWVSYLVGKFGTAANGGVAIYDLDNEPAWWDAVHRDVHPNPSTYDETTNNGISVAKAVKTADPTAEVSGPVVDYWWNYFYSKKDIEQGWGTGPCYQPWQNPADRTAHGGAPFVEYYLQQFKAASTNFGARLLDYLDLHTYFAGSYNGNGVGLTTAGDTQEQIVRLNSTRVFWDPTYTDPNYPQPNYTTDSNYTSSCNVPLQAPQLIPMAQAWVAADYPGTKIAFTEYNWGGQENVNGAVAQADILGIFGKYGLDLATLWGPPDPTTQVPGLMAFEIYRNYDGNNSMFGDTALNSNSANQGQLAVYGAQRTSDNAITVMVINKTYGPLSSTLSLENFTATGSTMAQVYQYSNANLNAITQPAAVAVTPPSGGETTSTVSYTFPAQSITLFVIPN